MSEHSFLYQLGATFAIEIFEGIKAFVKFPYERFNPFVPIVEEFDIFMTRAHKVDVSRDQIFVSRYTYDTTWVLVSVGLMILAAVTSLKS